MVFRRSLSFRVNKMAKSLNLYYAFVYLIIFVRNISHRTMSTVVVRCYYYLLFFFFFPQTLQFVNNRQVIYSRLNTIGIINNSRINYTSREI